MESKFDVDYFIQKFEAIPEEKWCTVKYRDRGACCSLGHCGEGMDDEYGFSVTDEAEALKKMVFIGLDDADVPSINDGQDNRFQQPTPKQRILAALRQIKEAQCSA